MTELTHIGVTRFDVITAGIAGLPAAGELFLS